MDTETQDDRNLARAMVAETTLNDYSANKEPRSDGELYDDAAVVIGDLITDLCHLLHLDEKTAGCMLPEDIRGLLDTAYNNFHAEAVEPDDIELASRKVADTYKFSYSMPDYCRVYFRDSSNDLYCWQNDGVGGIYKWQFYACEDSGEPSHIITPRLPFSKFSPPTNDMQSVHNLLIERKLFTA